MHTVYHMKNIQSFLFFTEFDSLFNAVMGQEQTSSLLTVPCPCDVYLNLCQECLTASCSNVRGVTVTHEYLQERKRQVTRV